MNNLKEPIATKLITQKKVSALAAPKKQLKKLLAN